MALNIKNVATHEKATRLAALMGTSITEAVDVALQEKIDRTETPEQKKDRIWKMVQEYSAELKRNGFGQDPVSDYGDDLYDEMGLPK